MAVVMVVVQILVSLTSVSVSAAVDFEHFHLHSTRAPPTKAVAENKHALTLFHRDTVTGRTRNHTTHRDHLNERLNRDARLVATLTRRLSTTRASNNYQVEDFASEVVSGLEEGSGEYFVRIGVGSPARNQYMVIDSGSDIVWVQCKPCKECYAQSDPVFDPAESSSFAGVACGSTVCGFLRKSGCSAGRCRYEVSYGDGSYTKGTLALETLTFGPTTVRDVAIGCGHRNRGLFVGAAGLLGLGRGPMSFVGQIGAQLGDAFAYCLVSRGGGGGGSLVFGRDSAVPIGAVWVPLLQSPRAPSFYYVGLVGLGVGGTRLPIPESVFAWSDDGDGGVVFDTGTAVTRFPSPVYEALRDAFVSSTMGLPRAHGPSIFDTCYDLSGFGSVRVPTVSFYFDDGPILTLPANNFMIPVDGMGTYCFAFAASESELSIIGNIQQEGIQISFDVANNLVGFGPYTC